MADLINKEDKNALALVTDFFLTVGESLPVAGVGLGIYRAVLQLNADSFDEKLHDFFQEATKASREEKQRLLKALDKRAGDFYKRIIKVLERLEDREKATILGGLFRGLCEQKLTIEQFNRLATLIDNTYLDTLKFLQTVAGQEEKERIRASHASENNTALHEKKQLVALGLLTERVKIIPTARRHKVIGGDRIMEQEMEFDVTDLGMILTNYGLSALFTKKK
ncbi:MAG: hypothetical protein JNJ75_14805 [Cyclobacteriaceae bacterium]|nr:hypothetical protein [Cyclobacteriaceae bacterium]